MIDTIGRLLLASFAIAGMAGCKTVRFEYPNARCRITKWNLERKPVVRVLPLVDMRTDKSSTEGWSMLCEIPLVPCMPFHNYDLQGYNGDVGAFDFDMKSEVIDAFVTHLNESGLARARVSAGKREMKGQLYDIEFRLHKIGIEGYRTCYCLGLFPGCYLHLFGMPLNYADMILDVEIVLTGGGGQVIFQKRYQETTNYHVNLYSNWNCLKFIGINICRLMNRFCADVQDVQPWSVE